MLTLIKQSALPLTAVITLAGCVLMGGQPWSLQCWALALVIFFIFGRVFSPLELRSHDRFTQRARRSTPRIALEWSCVAAMLWFLKMAFHLQVIQRDVFIAWLFADAARTLARRFGERSGVETLGGEPCGGGAACHHRRQ